MEQSYPPESPTDSTIKHDADKDSNAADEPVKLPPCDQCRRRKVKCDGRKIPCER